MIQEGTIFSNPINLKSLDITEINEYTTFFLNNVREQEKITNGVDDIGRPLQENQTFEGYQLQTHYVYFVATSWSRGEYQTIVKL